MKLSELQTGQQAVIVHVDGHGSFRKRLIEMGFIQGKTVRVVLNAPLRDPIEYEIIGYKVSLRREEARQIEVVTEEEAREVVRDHFERLAPNGGWIFGGMVQSLDFMNPKVQQINAWIKDEAEKLSVEFYKH